MHMQDIAFEVLLSLECTNYLRPVTLACLRWFDSIKLI